MSGRAEVLAARFEQINDEVIAAVEQCSDAQWQTPCANEGRSVGIVAHHVASSYLKELDCIQAFAMDRPLPHGYGDWALIDAANAQHAAEHANCTKGETVELLRRNGAAAAAYIREMSDAQLDHTAFFPLMRETRTTERMVERLLIGHPEEHLANIHATVASR